LNFSKPDTEKVAETHSTDDMDTTLNKDALLGTIRTIKKTTVTTVTTTTTTPLDSIDRGIVFKVQILASDVRFSAGYKKLKGQNANFYQEKNLYKYTVGSFRSFEEANRKRQEVAGRFPDAFVIAFRNGQKIPVEAARAEANK
ncbi:MAG: SPOR domain-containing protein, partial [Bacteroidia bacterium]|nr:SPOR domain-containing protein [Bacteroidia bacterium]